MRVIGGPFGLGKATFDGNVLDIKCTKKEKIPASEIKKVNILESKEQRFSIISFFLGGLLLGLLLTPFINIFGVLVGFALSGVASYYPQKKHTCEVELKSGDRLLLSGTKKELSKLII